MRGKEVTRSGWAEHGRTRFPKLITTATGEHVSRMGEDMILVTFSGHIYLYLFHLAALLKLRYIFIICVYPAGSRVVYRYVPTAQYQDIHAIA